MSETVRYTGKLKFITKLDFPNMVKHIKGLAMEDPNWNKHNMEDEFDAICYPSDLHGTFNNIDMLMENYLLISDDSEEMFYLFGVESERQEIEDYFCELEPVRLLRDVSTNIEKDFTFHTMFYNGGGCLSEMLEEKLRKTMGK